VWDGPSGDAMDQNGAAVEEEASHSRASREHFSHAKVTFPVIQCAPGITRCISARGCLLDSRLNCDQAADDASQKPSWRSDRAMQKQPEAIMAPAAQMVGGSGIEPLTSSVSTKRSVLPIFPPI
jgi:hypothetical protein